MKCQACKKEEALWSWQPLGPGENAKTFTLPGNQYRGFPVIKVCEMCRSAIVTGDSPVKFTYKGFRYICQDGTICEIRPSLWNGGMSSYENARGDAVMIMRDAPTGVAHLVAMVGDPECVAPFLATSDLMVAAELIREAFTDYTSLPQPQQLALAHLYTALDKAHGKSA